MRSFQYILLCMGIGVLSRLLIHIPDVTPMTTLALLSHRFISKRAAISMLILTLILSDWLLSYATGFPAFGTWTLFTYSGWLCIAICSQKNSNGQQLMTQTVIASFGFWLWTNFGSWCDSQSPYTHTLSGLADCYIAGLPFLRSSVIGSIIWTAGILMMLKKKVQPLALKKTHNNLR